MTVPRRRRVLLADYPLHIVQRGINREPCFFTDEDYYCYLHWLEESARACGCAIHAYVLMTNHVHLLLTPDETGSPSRLMQSLGRRYVQYTNRFYRRTGSLWEGRFKSSLVQAEDYLLACQRYIELNPVRAGMCAHPREYRWSSYRANAEQARDPLVTAHDEYRGLGATGDARRAAYRRLLEDQLDPAVIEAIRESTRGNYALGTRRFQSEIESMLGRRARRGSAGRPRCE